MTEHNRMPARQIIVYGDCWPVTIAVAHLVRRFLPGCNCETAYRLPVLLQQLLRRGDLFKITVIRRDLTEFVVIQGDRRKRLSR